MSVAPSFVFAKPDFSLVGRGVDARFASTAAARAAIASGEAHLVCGAFGFDPEGVAALTVPSTVERVATTAGNPAPPGPPADRTLTAPDVHRARVLAAVDAIDAGRVEKVVLARTLDLRFDAPIDPMTLLHRLTPGPASTTTTAFATRLDAAQGRRGHWLIGASPELLVRRTGRIVTCHPFAGSAPRSTDPVVDAAARDALVASDKDLREHAFVVDALVEALRPLCTQLEYDDRPHIESTPAVWHLATPIRGVLADERVTALDLAVALSPTPAVCGTPADAAARLIADLEGPRDFYAGAVGWCDAAGDGEWVVSIRCLELDDTGTRVTTWAGGGIVAGSDPDAEVAETEAKFRTVLGALGAVE